MEPVASLWNLDELCARVAQVLDATDINPVDGRVREVPDRRTVRYYTTLGLIDRPAAMRGRTALYGSKHLLQLAAIKRLQARGLTLADIQQRLLGLSEDELRPLAGLAGEPWASVAGPPPDDRQSRRNEFWRAAPAPVNPQPTVHQPTTAGVPAGLEAVRLSGQVMLLLAAQRSLREEDLVAIREAVAPLLGLLETRGLLWREGGG